VRKEAFNRKARKKAGKFANEDAKLVDFSRQARERDRGRLCDLGGSSWQRFADGTFTRA
jgi:hypothetical protein